MVFPPALSTNSSTGTSLATRSKDLRLVGEIEEQQISRLEGGVSWSCVER
jgi:hypothetical protein